MQLSYSPHKDTLPELWSHRDTAGRVCFFCVLAQIDRAEVQIYSWVCLIWETPERDRASLSSRWLIFTQEHQWNKLVSVKSLMINEWFNVGYKQSLPHCFLTQKTSHCVMWFGCCTEQNAEQCVCFSESVGLRGRLTRKVESLKAEQSGSEAPDEFLCPITRELMRDPVIAAG